jgi:hypothetical protein
MSSEKIALIIGVDSYYYKTPSGKILDQLPSSKKDAEDLCQTLSSPPIGYSIFNNNAIIGSNLDKEYGYTVIHKAIRDFFHYSRPEQLLLFYFSGHGIPMFQRDNREIFLATPQVNPDLPLSEGYPLSQLVGLVNSCKSNRVVCIIDSCYSGAAASLIDSTLLPKNSNGNNEETLSQTVLQAGNEIVQTKLNQDGKYFLLSTDPYTSSYSRRDPNSNSIYTKYLIEGIKGVIPDNNGLGSIDLHGWVTIETIHKYVSQKVELEAPFQHPVKQGTQYGTSPIIIAQHARLVNSIATQTSLTFENLKQMIQTLNDHYSKLLSLDSKMDLLEFWDIEGKGNLLKCLRTVQNAEDIIAMSKEEKQRISDWLLDIHKNLRLLKDARRNSNGINNTKKDLEDKISIDYHSSVLFLLELIKANRQKTKGKAFISKSEAEDANRKVQTILKFYSIIDTILYFRDGVSRCLERSDNENALIDAAHPYKNPFNNFKNDINEWLGDIQKIPEVERNPETKSKIAIIYKNLSSNTNQLNRCFIDVKKGVNSMSSSMDDIITAS